MIELKFNVRIWQLFVESLGEKDFLLDRSIGCSLLCFWFREKDTR